MLGSKTGIDFPSVTQTLNGFGIPFNHAKVYLTLLRLGLSTAKAISKNSGVERSETYRILAILEKLGLVERIISLPFAFRAVSISDAFAILMKRRMKENSELQRATKEIVKKLENKNAKTVLEEGQNTLSLVPEQVTMRREERALKTVQGSFDVVTSWMNPHSVIFVDLKEMAEALQRGAKIRVIIDKPHEEETVVPNIIKQLKEYPNFKIKFLLSSPKALIEIYDKKEAWVCTCTDPTLETCPTLRTTNTCLLSIFQDYFEIMWLKAMEPSTE